MCTALFSRMAMHAQHCFSTNTRGSGCGHSHIPLTGMSSDSLDTSASFVLLHSFAAMGQPFEKMRVLVTESSYLIWFLGFNVRKPQSDHERCRSGGRWKFWLPGVLWRALTSHSTRVSTFCLDWNAAAVARGKQLDMIQQTPVESTVISAVSTRWELWTAPHDYSQSWSGVSDSHMLLFLCFHVMLLMATYTTYVLGLCSVYT